MFPRLAAAALIALLPAGAIAQSAAPALNCTPSASPPKAADDTDNLSQQIHDKLAAEGFKDVQVRPTAFLVSAKDKDDKPVTLLIGPTSMTVLHGTLPGNDQAQAPPSDEDKAIPQ
jgi:hypothetical protein